MAESRDVQGLHQRASADVKPNEHGYQVFQVKKQVTGNGVNLVGDIPARFHSPPLLLCGSLTCMFITVVLTSTATMDFFAPAVNHAYCHRYNSEKGYFPATMGEIVHNRNSPGGMMFSTFGLIATVLILMSWYPMHLRNVYTGNSHFLGIYWTTWRQLLPAMGMLLTVGISTYPYKVAMASPGKTKLYCVVLHGCGSVMVFFGYVCCEVQCIGLSWKFWLPPTRLSTARLQHKEWWWRAGLMWVTLIAALLVFVCKFLLNFPTAGTPDFLCCNDEWRLPGDFFTINRAADCDHAPGLVSNTTGGENAGMPPAHLITPQLWDTASGAFFALKVGSFIFEDIAVFCVALSQLVIWYFCEERHFKAEDWVLDRIENVEWYEVKD